MVGQAPGSPRTCKFCEVTIKWRGDKWQTIDTLSQKCPNNAGGHRPPNTLRKDQKNSLGQSKI